MNWSCCLLQVLRSLSLAVSLGFLIACVAVLSSCAQDPDSIVKSEVTRGVLDELRQAAELERWVARDRSAVGLLTAAKHELVQGNWAEALALIEEIPLDEAEPLGLAITQARALRLKAFSSTSASPVQDRLQALEILGYAMENEVEPHEVLCVRALLIIELELRGIAGEYLRPCEVAGGGSRAAREAREAFSSLESRSAETYAGRMLALDRAWKGGDRDQLVALVQDDAGFVRDFVQNDLLPDWVEESDPQKKERIWDGILVMTSALEEASADRWLTTAVQHLESLRQAENADALRSFEEAFRLLQRGFRLYRSFESGPAAQHLNEARLGFENISSPFSSQADLTFWLNAAQSRFTPQVERALRDRRLRLEDSGYLHLAGLCEWGLSLGLQRQNRNLEAAVGYEEAIELLKSAGSKVEEWTAHSLLGQTKGYLGDAEQGWEEITAAWGAANAASPYRRLTIGLTVYWALRYEERNATACLVQRENLSSATEIGITTYLTEAHTELARCLSALGDASSALRELDSVQDLLIAEKQEARGSGGEDEAARSEADVLAVRGEVEAVRNPGKALGDLDLARAFYAKAKNQLLVAAVDRIRSRALWHLGRRAEARALLARSVDLVSQANETFPESEADLDRLPIERRLAIEEAVAREVREAGDRGARDALALVRQAQARTAPRRHEGSASQNGDTKVVGERPGIRLDTFVAKDSTFLWLTQGAETHFFEIPVSRRRLVRWVDGTRAELREGASGPQTHHLSTALLGPWLGSIPEGLPIRIAADGVLWGLPWNGLRASNEEPFLGLRFPLTLVVSGAALGGEPKHGSEGRVLVVGSSIADTSDSNRRSLPYAKEEAEAVARVYGERADLLVGADATKENVVKGLEGKVGFHFAGHVVVDDQQGDDGFLLLAPDASGQGARLSITDIEALELEALEWAVLSGCESAYSPRMKESRLGPLARAWINAGAETVVGTLWAIEDREEVVEYARSLQERMVSGVDPLQRIDADGPSGMALTFIAVSRD